MDRNAKPNPNSAAAPKKPELKKSRESANPILVLLLSLESQTVVCLFVVGDALERCAQRETF